MTVEQKTRIVAALRRTLDAEIDARAPGGAIRGPWAMVLNPGDLESAEPWADIAELSRSLYRDLRGHFSDDVIREILFAKSGAKVSRTYLADAKIDWLARIADHHGFQIVTGTNRYSLVPDKAKGGWCNRAKIGGGDEGLRSVYIAPDSSLADAARLLEEAGLDDLFGALLGIPECCRQAYERRQPSAQASQNDFVLPVLEDTAEEPPYDFRLNYVAQYFGRSLLSFFPCSFRCSAAAAVAGRTRELMSRCDAEWAQSFLDLQRTNILYTETQGLHLFRQPMINEIIFYAPQDVASTEQTEVAALIRRGDRLKVEGKHRVTVYRGHEAAGTVEGEDAGMCVFY